MPLLTLSTLFQCIIRCIPVQFRLHQSSVPCCIPFCLSGNISVTTPLSGIRLAFFSGHCDIKWYATITSFSFQCYLRFSTITIITVLIILRLSVFDLAYFSPDFSVLSKLSNALNYIFQFSFPVMSLMQSIDMRFEITPASITNVFGQPYETLHEQIHLLIFLYVLLQLNSARPDEASTRYGRSRKPCSPH